MLILGIDPGKRGGMAVSDSISAETMAMPVAGRSLDIEMIVKWLKEYGSSISRAYLERAWGIPYRDSVQTFNQGRYYGDIEAVVMTLGIPLIEITPKEWKRVVLAGTKKDKRAAIDYVVKKYPGTELRGSSQSRVPHEGIIEAICIAEYGWRMTMNTKK